MAGETLFISLFFYLAYICKKKLRRLFLSNDKIHIENLKLGSITNFKSRDNDFSLDISFSAIVYTKSDKNTVDWSRRSLPVSYFPIREIGEEIVNNQCFKQRWFFIYESKKIKGVYIR